jgi:3-oxoacyl-[acyl-carrier protein] reductase
MTQGALHGQVAFVTGGGSGLGAAFARRLAADGAAIVVNDLSADAASAVAIDVGGDTAVFDVCDSAAFDAEVDKAVERHGRLDILINNAGIAPPPDPARTQLAIDNQMKRIEGRVDELVPPDATVDMSDADWDRMLRVHLYGAFYGTRAALRHMTPARRGAIINVSSVLGLRPMAGAPSYSAAKAGIIALTKSVGQEVAPFGVRVNAICPGWVDTPLLAPMDPMMMAGIVTQIPRGRMAAADELAELVRFLAGPESSYCNGDVFAASGGFV